MPPIAFVFVRVPLSPKPDPAELLERSGDPLDHTVPFGVRVHHNLRETNSIL